MPPSAALVGFGRDADGRLMVTSTVSDAAWREGFLRSPSGSLVVEDGAAGSYWNGFLRKTNGVLCVAIGGTVAAVVNGLPRDSSGRLVIEAVDNPTSQGFDRNASTGRLGVLFDDAVPDWSKTVLHLGDIHVGAVSTTRTATALAALQALPAPAVVVQIGDLVEPAGATNDPGAITFMNALPGAVKRVIIGNHDMRLSASSRDGDVAAAAYGFNARNWTYDIPGVARLIGVSPLTWESDGNITLDATALTWLSTDLAASALPTIVFMHAALPNTVTARTTGGPDAGYSTNTPSFAIDPYLTVMDTLSSNVLAKAVVSGHTHSYLEATDFAAWTHCGARYVASINTSAIRGTHSPARIDDSLLATYTTITATELEVRVYDLAASAWKLWPDTGTYVKHFPHTAYVPSTPAGAFVFDTFGDADGTTLQTHTGQAGVSPWIKHPLATGDVLITKNRARVGSGVPVYTSSASPATADYDVTIDLLLFTDNNSSALFVFGRLDATVLTGYTARYNTTGNVYELYRFVSGTSTLLGSVAGDPGKLTLRMRGDKISLLVADIVVIGPITDTVVTAAGKPGLRWTGTNSDVVGQGLTKFAAFNA